MKKLIAMLSIMTVLFLTGCNFKKNEQTNELSSNFGEQQQIVEDVNGEQRENNEEQIKTLLVNGSGWNPVSAYDLTNNKESDLFEVYGSGIHYGGTLDFKEDGTFTKTIGVYAENYMGEYEIDTNKNAIYFTFETGMKMEGSYQYENGEIVSVDIVEGSDDWKYRVTLNKKMNTEVILDAERLITLEDFDINKLRELIDTENLDFDKEYVIGYAELGKTPVNYKVMYKKTSSYLGLEEYIILKNDLTELELCFSAERSDYIEKIFMINEENILVLATYNAHGDSSQNIYMYDYKLNPLKNSEGREHDLHYDDWVVALGYEHQYGFDIINDKIIVYRNDYNTNEKVTYQVDIEEDTEIEKYYYSVNEKARTTEGFHMGAGRT